jgi:hypothetical protein
MRASFLPEIYLSICLSLFICPSLARSVRGDATALGGGGTDAGMGASLSNMKTATGAPARFPVGTWIAAGACLGGLALSERFIVGPMRKQQEAEGTAPSTSLFGDIAVVTGEAYTKKSQAKLPDGMVLMEDGSIRRKP